MAVDQLVIDPEMRIWTGLHIIPGLYVLESNAGQMGSSLEWFARLVHGDVPNPAAMLDAEAQASAPGAHGVTSTIGAAVFNAAAMEPPVDNLTFSSVAARLGDEARADVARAVLEGMAYAVRANIEQILRVSGGTLSDLWLGGGITRSSLWTGIVSDVMKCNVHVSASAEATALGAAICAGVGAGLFPDLGTGAHFPPAPARPGLARLPVPPRRLAVPAPGAPPGGRGCRQQHCRGHDGRAGGWRKRRGLLPPEHIYQRRSGRGLIEPTARHRRGDVQTLPHRRHPAYRR
jgi:sugar (pentulose or hexulose) kinase